MYLIFNDHTRWADGLVYLLKKTKSVVCVFCIKCFLNIRASPDPQKVFNNFPLKYSIAHKSSETVNFFDIKPKWKSFSWHLTRRQRKLKKLSCTESKTRVYVIKITKRFRHKVNRGAQAIEIKIIILNKISLWC